MMKQLILAGFLVGYVSSSQAAFVACRYVHSCNDLDHHYYCKLIGWTGPNPPTFCSETDVSTFRRGTSPVSEQEFIEGDASEDLLGRIEKE